MTETDKLRRMLDERGIEYEQSCIEGIAEYTHVTKWLLRSGNKCTFYEIEDGYPPYFTRMFIDTPTAAQAIAATVGRGTCHMELLPDEPVASIQPMRCTACGHKTYAQLASFCPHCGAVVVE